MYRKQPGRHTDWLCNGRGLSVAAGIADRDRADWQAGTATAVKGVTLCHRKQGTLFGGDQPSYPFAYARRAVGLQRRWR